MLKSLLKSKISKLLIFSIFLVSCFSFNASYRNSQTPQNGYVPNKETAAKIAEVIWIPLFGEKVLNFKPYKVTLKNDSVWAVEGTLKDSKGGVPYMEISKMDCKVLLVKHGK